MARRIPAAAAAFALAALVCSFGSHADCIRTSTGQTVCGKGKCELDQYGKAFCAPVGGDAVRDEHGDVVCGPGRCEKDMYQKVWCSKEPGGGAARDQAGGVKCLAGCAEATRAMCTPGE